MKPQHFDIIGFAAFAYIMGFAIYALVHNGNVPIWAMVLLILIGLGGLIVDGAIVFLYFIKKK